ncbi:ATP-binding cassette domain-containing protein [Aliigemmobacter aestuarii]|uniref:ATP-binding cassette domain-containing protein n=1 Tax=Aliigemmobacter aestuarii TaxID=1445661 RepID=A0A4V3V0V9_9RHOB|nr:ATP-binding cassette domain-containing protein [Gemmobacter aestuarii]THD85472.1 ATP-binding cassette domain-containing protein [Gemmobacter aestuarii]
MLTLDGLEITLGDWTLRADWSLPTGVRCALIGPSGAGKSTLMLAVAGFVEPTRGRVIWQGQDLAGLSPGDRPVSILFQDQNLFPHLTVAENLGLGIAPNRRPTRAEQDRIAEVLDRVGLAGMGARKPAQLSGGQAGRAALARALLRQRPLLLLDEPFAALGPALRAEMLDLVAEVADETGATVLMVTHDPADARRLCDLTVFVDEGRAGPPADTAALFADPPLAVRAYLGL